MLLSLRFCGQQDQPLVIQASVETISTQVEGGNRVETFSVQSDSMMRASDKSPLDKEALEKRFRSFNNADYIIQEYDFSGLSTGLSIPFKDLTALKNRLAFLLNNSVDVISPVELPKLQQHAKVDDKPGLSLLISDEKDAHLGDVTDADIYFKLPESFKKNCDKYIELLKRNPRFIPWFPAVLIGKDYLEAVRILEEVKPAHIVSNNTGVAYKAFEMGIEWIAGPFLNTTNSYALNTLQEDLNCSGAFISNEINRMQIRNLKRPPGFKLLYSIYHPILMMTSRQCFFQQTVGCNKPSIEDGCMLKCEKATTITNVKGISFAVDKQKGGYPSIYNDEQFLNLDVIQDYSNLFDEFFIDLTDIGSGSKAKLDKIQLIEHFENLLQGSEDAKIQLDSMVTVSTHAQYKQGL
ncbi:hypothetical protein SVI_3122 [Shewanella violacea DSS12]|uniref:Peptidase, U32 family n=2 Tax=Shewanella violacea TaxID=60217 RepID=D4ZAP8_SHEVD|nr:hypothetical protein SVI_3122 [Shewanella violacea DSS12]